MTAWASEDFFPGEGKIFLGGTKTYYMPKIHAYNLFFSKNILFLANQAPSPHPWKHMYASLLLRAVRVEVASNCVTSFMNNP
jgi:hypothetical protein